MSQSPDSGGQGPRPRGVRPDAETATCVHLVKNVPFLRATYQVRTLAFLARQRGKRLVLNVPAGCRFDAALEELARAPSSVIRREDIP